MLGWSVLMSSCNSGYSPLGSPDSQHTVRLDSLDEFMLMQGILPLMSDSQHTMLGWSVWMSSCNSGYSPLGSPDSQHTVRLDSLDEFMLMQGILPLMSDSQHTMLGWTVWMISR